MLTAAECVLQSDGACTWEPADNLSEDLVRDFEESFWAAIKKNDEAFVETALEHGAEAVVAMVDSDSRSALHFGAALNNKKLVQVRNPRWFYFQN